MPGLISDLRLGLIPPVAFILLASGCQHQPPSTSPAPSAQDSIDVGYGTQAKHDVTGSISAVDGHDARRTTATNIADLLDGRVAGLDVRRLPNGAVSIRIRGDRSLLSSGEPLIVVDGIPRTANDGVLQDLDPRDVASISVLKDAGSLAAYGSRGANGVILITTKKQ